MRIFFIFLFFGNIMVGDNQIHVKFNQIGSDAAKHEITFVLEYYATNTVKNVNYINDVPIIEYHDECCREVSGSYTAPGNYKLPIIVSKTYLLNENLFLNFPIGLSESKLCKYRLSKITLFIIKDDQEYRFTLYKHAGEINYSQQIVFDNANEKMYQVFVNSVIECKGKEIILDFESSKQLIIQESIPFELNINFNCSIPITNTQEKSFFNKFYSLFQSDISK
jgi:hypothetical protein